MFEVTGNNTLTDRVLCYMNPMWIICSSDTANWGTFNLEVREFYFIITYWLPAVLIDLVQILLDIFHSSWSYFDNSMLPKQLK